MRWCKEHKDLDRFGPPERNTLRSVWWFVFPLVLFDVLKGSLFALIYLGGTGLHGKSYSSSVRIPVRGVQVVSKYVD